MRNLVASRKAPSVRGPKPAHGSWARYCAGCPCVECKRACTEYGQARRQAKKAGIPFVTPAHLLTPEIPASAVADTVSPPDDVILRRYSYQVKVPADTAVRLNRVFGGARFVYNAYIAHARAEYEAGRKHPSFFDGSSAIVTGGRNNPETSWIRDLPGPALTLAVRNAARAYDNFFASVTGRRKGPKVGFPRFKKRSSRQTASFPVTGFSINGGRENTQPGGGRVWIHKVGYVHVNWHRPLPADPTSVTMIRESDGTMRMAFVTEVPKPRPTVPTREPRAAGIDVGLTDFAAIVYSDGTREKVENPRYLRHAERKLRRAQKHLSRTQKGSRNREKARREVAGVHTRVRNLRENHARQFSARLTRENQAVSVETLNIRGLARGTLSKSVHDVGWGQFLTFLEEASTRKGRDFVKVPQNFPSSRICSHCGVNTGAKPLHVRAWTCDDCGARHDRDYNAAVNIMVAAGSAETVNACGRDVRRRLSQPSAVSGGAIADEAGTHRHDRVHRRPASRKPRARSRVETRRRTHTTTAHRGYAGPDQGNATHYRAAEPQERH